MDKARALVSMAWLGCSPRRIHRLPAGGPCGYPGSGRWMRCAYPPYELAHCRQPRGFTLIELLVVLALAGFLIGVVPPLIGAAFPGVQGAALAREVAAIEESPVVVGPPLRRLVLEVIAADSFSMFVADLRTLYQLTKVEAAGHDERRHVGALDGASLRARLRGLSCALAPALRALEEP